MYSFKSGKEIYIDATIKLTPMLINIGLNIMHHDLSLERLNNYLLCKLGILRTRMASESIGWNSTICFFFLVFLVSSLPFFCLRVILKIGSSFDVPLSGCTAS